jgi:hypothetical protein
MSVDLEIFLLSFSFLHLFFLLTIIIRNIPSQNT